MQFFCLVHPLDEVLLCEDSGCSIPANYLEITDNGAERCYCGLHTRSEKHFSRLPGCVASRRTAPRFSIT